MKTIRHLIRSKEKIVMLKNIRIERIQIMEGIEGAVKEPSRIKNKIEENNEKLRELNARIFDLVENKLGDGKDDESIVAKKFEEFMSGSPARLEVQDVPKQPSQNSIIDVLFNLLADNRALIKKAHLLVDRIAEQLMFLK